MRFLRLAAVLRRAAKNRRARIVSAGAAAALALCYAVFLSAPPDFPARKVIAIPTGATLSEAATLLAEARVVRYAAALRFSAYFFGGEGNIKAGGYQFESPRNVLRVARALTAGNFGVALLRVTVPEGATAADIAALFDPNTFPNFNAEEFAVSGRTREGYLFPDTYRFLPGVTAAEAREAFRMNFLEKVAGQRETLLASGRPLSELVIMASLLEKEARSMDVRRTIAGILWKRLELGIPLQVDAVFGYINSRPTYHPTLRDLEVDSPYNTYKYRGLPPGPIGNPGLEAIIAAATPIESEYLYYLTDREGVMRYATTYEGHLANKRKYLP